MTLEEVNKQIEALQKERIKLINEKTNHDLELAKKNVGRCFKNGEEYIKVLDEPEKKFDEWTHSYNGYTIFVIDTDEEEDEYPFDFTDVGINFKLGYEVSQEEFNEQFEKAVARLRERVGVNDKD